MPSHAPDTDELLQRAEQGDGQARQAVLVRHRDRLKQMVAVHLDRRLAARIDPSDVVQEALLDAAQGLVSEGAVKTRHLRALERLRVLLESEAEGE